MKKLFSRWFTGRRFEQETLVKDRNLIGIIDLETPLLRVASGFQFTEGPVWVSRQEGLFFSDIPGDTIYSINGAIKDCRPYRSPSNHSNGLTLDNESRLITCEHGTRQVTRTEKDGAITVLCSHYKEKRFNSPNDVIVKSDGSIYFTDPIFGIKPEDQEQPVQGVYRYSPTDKSVVLIIDSIKMPNGLVFSPDESILYVDSSHREERKIFRFDVTVNGDIVNKQVFYDLESDEDGTPDGMKVDTDGNLYCTGPGGLWVFSASGTYLGSIVLPELPSNCAWGDADLRTLYITARSSIYSLRTRIGGLAPGEMNNNREIR